jgi:hypothetical protein
MYLRFRKDTDDTRTHFFGLWDQGAATPPDVSGTTIDVSFRVTSDATTTDGKFGLDSGISGTLTNLHNDLDIDTWYEFWVVINQTTDKFDAYIRGGTITAVTPVASGLS